MHFVSSFFWILVAILAPFFCCWFSCFLLFFLVFFVSDEKQGDPNVGNGVTSLWEAINQRKGPNVAMFELLIKNGADPNIRSRSVGSAGFGVLQKACQLRRMDLIKLI